MIVFLVSCNAVLFDSPQPKEGKILYVFPEKFEGIYLNEDNDTVIIENNSITTLSKFDSTDYKKKKLHSIIENATQLGHRFLKVNNNGKYFYNELVLDSLWFVSYVEFEADTLNFFLTTMTKEMRKTIFRNFDTDSLSGNAEGSVMINSKTGDIYKFIELGLYKDKLKFIKIKLN